MNEPMNGNSSIAAGQLPTLNGGNTTVLPRIHEALELVHSPYSSNDSRQQASLFLDEIKADDEAPYHGFTLAADQTQQPVVRHYALSLLEHAIKHKWADYTEAQASTLRDWVLQLSRNLKPEDPLYLRNKTSQLWVEIAKRSWAAEWMNMDEMLVQLWELPGLTVHKEFVLFVLETLSDEVFNGEDTIAILREGVLSKACVEIFTPAIVLAEAFPKREIGRSVRHGEEGWLVRLGQLLSQCLSTDPLIEPQSQVCAVKSLAVYKSVMPWAIPKAIDSASCVRHMCTSLASSSVSVQLVSICDSSLGVTNLCRLPWKLSMLCTAVSISQMKSFSLWYVPCTQVNLWTYFGNCSNGLLLIQMISTTRNTSLQRSSPRFANSTLRMYIALT